MNIESLFGKIDKLWELVFSKAVKYFSNGGRVVEFM